MLLRNTFRAFRHRDYFIFWCGLFLGHTGTLVQATAQSWLIFQLTNSPFYLGLEGLCLGLPRVVFSPLGGAIVDRANRKILFVVTQTAFLLMALFLGVMDYLGTIRVWHVLSISALTGFFVSFEQPVRQSILHQLVPRSELPNAVTLYQMVFNGSMLFGPSIGGLLIPFIDTKGCFFVATIGNAIVLLTIFMIHIAVTARPTNKTTVSQDIAEGLALAWNTPVLLSLFTVLGIVTFCTKPYTQFMPVFARDILTSRSARPWPSAHGTGSRRDSRRSHPRVYSPLSETALPAFFSRSRFWFLNYLLRRFAAFSAFTLFSIFRRWLSDHFSFLRCDLAANPKH
jgi:MFS transporter, DHA1 family, staphyloferrin A biosynthesis exporter